MPEKRTFPCRQPSPTQIGSILMDADKKAKLKAWRKQQERELRDSIPMPESDLRDLFVLLDREDAPTCDHTLRETMMFLKERSLDVEKIVSWLQSHGGYCDCEVIYNVQDKFQDILGND
jgi:hypothetical protein